MITNTDLKKMMEDFDFDKVKIAMDALGWNYLGGRTPVAIEELKTMVRTLHEGFKDWNTDKFCSTSSGGFTLEKRNGDCNAELRFVVECIDWIGGEHDND
jgi:hypothetical protein